MDALSQEYTFKSLSQNMKNHQICYMCASTLIHIVFIWPSILILHMWDVKSYMLLSQPTLVLRDIPSY